MKNRVSSSGENDTQRKILIEPSKKYNESGLSKHVEQHPNEKMLQSLVGSVRKAGPVRLEAEVRMIKAAMWDTTTRSADTAGV